MEIALVNDVEFLPVKELIAGDVSVLYEEGHLRYIKYKGHEVIRMIYQAIRDANWKTMPFAIKNELIEENANGYLIQYDAIYDSDDIKYEAKIEMHVGREGVSYEMRGKSPGKFVSRRIGICVLHPVETCAGIQVEIIRPDGDSVLSVFPVLISASQPFTDIEGMKYNNVQLTFEGDVFETEDQRNWTDDSYKTYSGPQYLVPILNLSEGDEMRQKVRVEFKEPNPGPAVGRIVSSEGAQASRSETRAVKNKFPEIHLTDNSTRQTLTFACFSEEEISSVSNSITKETKSILVLSAHDRTATKEEFTKVYQQIKKDHADIQIGYGSSSWFANLNSVLPINFPHDFLGFTICPQTHLTDGRTIMENLLSQHYIIDTISNKSSGIPIHVSVKFSTSPDERSDKQFAKWWMLHTVANLREAEVITFERSNSVLDNIREFKPTGISAERDRAITDLISSVMKTRIILKNASGEELCFTMKDI